MIDNEDDRVLLAELAETEAELALLDQITHSTRHRMAQACRLGFRTDVEMDRALASDEG